MSTQGTFLIQCTHCKKTGNIELHCGLGLRVGDILMRDPSSPDRGRCGPCQTFTMKITKVPAVPVPENTTGFTRIPKE